MAKQTFTTGQVLTAAEMTALQLNDYNQTVSAKVASYTLVAADAGTRITMSNAGATTITVNTSLFAAGDTLFITNIGAGATTITAGTATVSTASSLVLAQYDSGRLYFTSTGVAIWEKYQGAAVSASGLTLISSTGFSAVTSFAKDSCFSATYSRYRILVNFDSTSAGVDMSMKLRVGGVDSSAASYQSKTMYAESAGVWQTFWGNSLTTGFKATSNMPTTGGYLTFDISNPFQSLQTNCTMQSGSTDRMVVGTWAFGATTSFDGFDFISNGATVTGNYKIYGYQES